MSLPAMFAAAYSGDNATLSALLAAAPATVHSVSPDRRHTLLYTASRAGHLETVKLLLASGAKVDAVNASDDGSQAIHGACYGGHPAVVQCLMAHGADPACRNAYGEAPSDNAKRPAAGVTKAAAKLCTEALKCTPAVTTAAPIPVPATTVALDGTADQRTTLSSMTLAELRALAGSLHTVLSGTKTDLIDRIIAVTKAMPSPPPSSTAAVVPAAPTASATSVVTAEEPAMSPPPTKKHMPEPTAAPVSAAELSAPAPAPQLPVAAAAVAPVAAVPPSGGASSTLDPAWIDALSKATFTKVEIPRDTEEFWALEERVMACNQRHNEDYVTNRLKKKKKPLTFIVKRAWKVTNPTLEAAFQRVMATFAQEDDKQLSRVRVAFHGTREANLDSILKTSLLRFQHPLNPCKEQADDGYFGTNKKGVYVSRYYEYCLKYSNDLVPLDEGQCAKVIMFKCLPGKSKHIEKLNMGMDPTPGFHSHSSPSYLEWYLFDERQLCPEFVVELQAKVDTRTAADDE